MSGSHRRHASGLGFGLVHNRRKLLLGAAGVLALAGLVFNVSQFAPDTAAHEWIEYAGLALIVICIVGRTWSSMYIGGRKLKGIVTDGPYSIVRNPLYVFSVIGAAGVGMQLGSVTAGGLLGTVVFIFFYLLTIQEERVLEKLHGDVYRDYCSRVPRMVPDLRLWHDAERIEISPRVVRSTFFDALIFLVAVPAFEMLENLQVAGYVPTLFHIY
ncbi:MAG: isoprenylcysteine carboxylmethyltransferase family protein [Flavobacteriaceae bacterium]